MKIALCNHRYFVSGGPEKYMFNFKDYAEGEGHAVFPLSVDSPRNLECEWSNYFFSSVSSRGDDYYNPDDKSFSTLAKTVIRQFYSPEVYLKTRHFAKELKPDVAYILHYLNKVSPAIIDSFLSSDIPCVVRISDFGAICPQAHLYSRGGICDACLSHGYRKCIENRCIKDSAMASVVKTLAYYFNILLNHRNRISAFVFPSNFTMQMYIKSGFPAGRCYHIPTMVTPPVQNLNDIDGRDDYILFVGRFVPEKGVHQLLEAYSNCSDNVYPLTLVGYKGESSYEKGLREEYHHIADFRDFAAGEELGFLYKNASFVVIPSVWYDNQPNVLLEAASHGKMVIVPKHGCFLDLVDEGNTGLFYNPSDTVDLAEKIQWACNNPQQVKRMGENGFRRICMEHAPSVHHARLMKVFDSVRGL